MKSKNKNKQKEEPIVGHTKIPKKLLRIEDLTFVLPDDFEGGIEDAFRCLTDYINTTIADCIRSNLSEDENFAIVISGNNDRKISLKYGIFEVGEDGEYHLT